MDRDEERLYYCICASDSASLMMLIKQGLDVDTAFVGSHGGKSLWSALHLCCEKGSYDCAKVLLDSKACPDLQDKWNQTPLMYSVCGEWGDLVRLLVSSGCNLDAKDRRGMTALHKAVYCSTPEMMQIIIKAGANVNAKEIVHCTPLWLAVSSDGHLAHAKCLINSGCDLNIADIRTRRTALQTAIVHSKREKLDYVRMLLAAGAGTGLLKGCFHTALMTLVLNNWTSGCQISEEEKEIATLLLATQCDINAVATGKGKLQRRGTALKMAVERGADVLVQMFLDAGANPDLTDDSCVTPLHLAVLSNRIDIVQMLLVANCKMDPTAMITINVLPLSLTPFQCALYRIYLDIAELMITCGYDGKKERYLLSSEAFPDYPAGNVERLFFLQEKLSTPHPLLVLCRSYLRTFFGNKIRNCVPELPIPPYIKGLLFLHDLM